MPPEQRPRTLAEKLERLFQTITGKTAPVLGEEWRAALPRTPADLSDDAMTDYEDTSILWWGAFGGGIGGAGALGITWWRKRAKRRVP